MATSKDDIKHATAQAKHSEDEAQRVAYKHGTPLESGKIAESKPVDLFSGARNIEKANRGDGGDHGDPNRQGGGAATDRG